MTTSTIDGLESYLDTPVVLVGAGGVGSHVLPLLVQIGTPVLTIWDDQRFGRENRHMQLFPYEAMGEYKAEVLAEEALRLNPAIEVCTVLRRFMQEDYLDGVVVAAVDSIQSRRVIFEEALRQRERVMLYMDGRLSRAHPWWVEVYAIDPRDTWETAAYREWLYGEGELERAARPAEFAAHGPHLLSALIGGVLARWVKDKRHPWKMTLDATAWNLESFHAPREESAWYG